MELAYCVDVERILRASLSSASSRGREVDGDGRAALGRTVVEFGSSYTRPLPKVNVNGQVGHRVRRERAAHPISSSDGSGCKSQSRGRLGASALVESLNGAIHLDPLCATRSDSGGGMIRFDAIDGELDLGRQGCEVVCDL